ncbi:hypothetical protein MHYP_G00308980 [Metynnis hypsauchen]
MIVKMVEEAVTFSGKETRIIHKQENRNSVNKQFRDKNWLYQNMNLKPQRNISYWVTESPESSSVCVRREGEVCGRLVKLVEMPALYNTQLSEEEVMQETLHCVSLCDPGVHAFLLIIPEGRLTDEDKGEMEKIQ